MAMHKVQQEQLPIVLIGAGLPALPRLAGVSKSYAERLFSFPVADSLEENEAAIAIQHPILEEGEEIEEAAVQEIIRITQGYPYFLQVWGHQVWNHVPQSPINLETVINIHEKVLAELDSNFFRDRFDRLTKGEKDFLRTMAELGEGPHKMKDVADIMNLEVNSLSPRRTQLIYKGMVYSPQHGEISFTVPLFHEFMQRAIPQFTSRKRHHK